MFEELEQYRRATSESPAPQDRVLDKVFIATAAADNQCTLRGFKPIRGRQGL